MALLKFLFISICVLYLIKMVTRLLLPIFFKKIVSKVQQQANQRYQQQQPTKANGTISVDYIPPREKDLKSDTAGDFVEYEEIKTPKS